MTPPRWNGRRPGHHSGAGGRTPAGATYITDGRVAPTAVRAAVERIRGALEDYGSRVCGSNVRLRAVCPAHESHGSLTLAVSQGRSGALIKCHAQCDTADVLTALGLTWEDMFDTPREHKPRWQPRRMVRDPSPAERLTAVLSRAVDLINLRWHMQRAPLWPRLSWQERAERAEEACREDADSHYWRTLARWAALACDETYVTQAYATPPHKRTHEQVCVLLTRAEDLERAR